MISCVGEPAVTAVPPLVKLNVVKLPLKLDVNESNLLNCPEAG
tara:strand:- start:1287 stop:1415 length:129 start_codon:yes stop_codon:yes gene_type:complete